MKKILLGLSFLSLYGNILSQDTMNVYQNNGIVLAIPMSLIDSITYTIGYSGSLPSLTTLSIDSATQNSAISGGNILDSGGTTVTHRGICWSTSPNPTTANDTTNNGNGIGYFISSLTGLTPNTIYYLRAFAINSAGTAYGNEMSFSTCPNCSFCFDGVLNNGEVNIDCGGPNCQQCDHCLNGIYDPDLGETWLDCGGACPVCPTCANGIMDGDEMGVDCGGTCGGCEQLCGDGLLNGFEDQVDCENQGEMPYGGCEYCPTCIDGLFNGQEVGIDCGGPNCEPCCSTGNCGNGIKDGAEFFIDCGGNSCPDCSPILSFNLGSTSLFTPELSFAPPFYDEIIGSLTFTMEPVYDANPESPPIPLGELSLIVDPASDWSAVIGASLSYPIPFSDPNQLNLVYIDDLGFVYTSTLPGGDCSFTIEGHDELNITIADVTNGCNKPIGLYRFFRASFNGTLVAVDPTAPSPSVSISQGIFQFTFTP